MVARWINPNSFALNIHDPNLKNIVLKPGQIVEGEYYRNQSPPLKYLDDGAVGLDMTTFINVGEILGNSDNSESSESSNIQSTVRRTSDPTSSDVDYPEGTNWLNTSTNDAFILIDITGGVATWEAAGGGEITALDGGVLS